MNLSLSNNYNTYCSTSDDDMFYGHDGDKTYFDDTDEESYDNIEDDTDDKEYYEDEES